MTIRSSITEQERTDDEGGDKEEHDHNQKGQIHDIQVIDVGDKKDEDADIDLNEKEMRNT